MVDNILNMGLAFFIGIFAGLAMMSAYVSKDLKKKRKRV